jgi:acyl-CoA synthetase (NDP forming)
MRDLSRLLRPRSIAVFGGGWAENVVRECVKIGFDGPVWPVHPTRESMAGVPCLRSIDHLPAAPDAAFIGVNRTASVEVIERLSAMGAGGAVAFASGFAETADGAEIQRALVAAAGPMPVLGPNCYGIVNYLDGAALWPDQHGGARVERGVAFVSQSSNIALNVTMQRRGLPLAYAICVGNQAQSGLAEIGATLAADPRVTAIGFYIESVGDPAAFAAMAAEARAAGKPIIVLRAGRSEASRAATISHTASLTGQHGAAEAWFRRIGAPLARSLPDLLDALQLLHVHGPLAGRELISLSCSGGEASLVADAAEGRRLCFARFSEADRARIAATLNPFVAIANPLDYHTFIWGDEAALTRTFTAALTVEAALALLILDFPHEARCDTESWEPALRAIAAAARATGRPAAVVSALPENMPEARAQALASEGLAPLTSIDGALGAAELAADAAEPPGAPPLSPPLLRAAPPALLDEAEAKRRLSTFGLATPEGDVGETPEAAGAIARRLGGAVAVKRLGIAHKTEAGAVALAPDDPEAAARGMGSGPYLVERLIAGGVGELIVGVARDPEFGPILTVGIGGVAAELLADVQCLALPADPVEIEAALRRLRLFPLLDGWRGKPRADLAAAVDAIAAVARFAEAHSDALEELEVNPLIVTCDGAWAADALIRIREMR